MADLRDAKPSPWSIKGVSGEARAITKQAAAATGLNMGQWLSRVIQAHDKTPPPEQASVDEPAALLHNRLTHRLAESEARIVGVIKPLYEIIQQIAIRLETLEAQIPAPTQHGQAAPRTSEPAPPKPPTA